MHRSTTTRFLHGALAALVLNQLVLSLVMDDDGRGIGGTAFEVHETMGMVTGGMLLLFWLWTLARRGETPVGMLFPWVSPTRLRSVLTDAGDLLRLRLSEHDRPNALASAIHGLGLLVVTGACITGAVHFGLGGEDGRSLFSEAAEELHEGFGTLMWVYVAGHAGMAVLHALSGRDIVRRMFIGESSDKEPTL